MSEPTQPDAARFEHKDEDVTCCCELLFCGGSKLILGEEEVEFNKCLCCNLVNEKKRGPYGELGTVDSVQTCCFYGFAAGSLMGEDSVQCTGCGCERSKVDEIVRELKNRQALRGDRAKIRLAEATAEAVHLLNEKMDLLLAHFELENPGKAPPLVEAMQRD